jgi:hypothetical protein
MPKKKHKSSCVYCGNLVAGTRDHIPPKALFAKPRPSDLITVPSCLQCNGSASTDDEYFLFAVSSRFDTGDHPDAAEANRSVFRGLALPQKEGLRRYIVNITREVNARTPAGIHLGKVGVYAVDFTRLCRVPERNIAGLFYHHFKRRLEDDHRVFVWAVDGIDPSLIEVEGSFRHIVQALTIQPAHKAGRDVLRYRYYVLEGHENISAWFLTYYERVHFLGITIPREQQGNDA